MTNNAVAKEDLEILLADHIKNAIIAVNHTENINRTIMVRLGKIDSIYGINIYDSGAELETENLTFKKRSHSLIHKQKALEYKIQQMMMQTEISEEQAGEVKEKLEKIGEEIYKEKENIELEEEIGLKFSKKDAIFFKESKAEEGEGAGVFKDFWLFKSDVKIEDIIFPDQEAIDAKWVTIDELIKMIENDEIISGQDFGRKDYELAIDKSI